MLEFFVRGEFKITVSRQPGGKCLEFDQFWEDADVKRHSIALQHGCYVFAVKTSGGGLKPVYVGQATKSFYSEVFNPTNKEKFRRGFLKFKKGTPVMFFVIHPKQRGAVNTTKIDQIETFLIESGAACYEHIENVQKVKIPKWSIKGVVRPKQGQPSKEAKSFKKLFKL